MARPILLCTVGTSLIHPNLSGLRRTLAEDDAKPPEERSIPPERRATAGRLADAHDAGDWDAVADRLAEWPPTERLCGAEVNSVASLVATGYAPPDAGVFLFHSDTDDGRHIAGVLARYFRARGHAPVEAVAVADLQDKDPKRFRTHGLRNLAKRLSEKVRGFTPAACAINATGGYKAQIAVAVLLGQALGIPVYYMHERFTEIIAFPPLPVALDFEVWLHASGMLGVLERSAAPVPRAAFAADWDERFESLTESVLIDGADYLELSATGQIFHDTFRERFRSNRDRVLPPPAAKKFPPRLEASGWPGEYPEVGRFLDRVTNEVPQVVRCTTHYFNPDLAEPTRFRESRGGVEGIYSTGGATAKFVVETTAQTPGQCAAVVAALNEWLAAR